MRTILVVEGNKHLCAAITVYLKSQGIEPIATETLQEATSVLKEREIDLVILDSALDADSNLNVLKYLRESLKLTAMPVLVVSAWDMEPASYDYLEPGDYVIKPFDMRVLDGMIEQLCEIGQNSSAYDTTLPQTTLSGV